MQIELNTLSPRIAGAYREQVVALLQKDPADPTLSREERRARDFLEQQEHRDSRLADSTRSFLSLGSALYIVGLYLDSYLDAVEPLVKLAALVLLLGAFAVAVPTCLIPGRTLAGGARRRCSVEEMRTIFPLVLRSRAEALYGDALLQLAEADPPMETPLRRSLLGELNALIENSAAIDRHRERVRAQLAQATGVELIEDERAALARRLDETHDPIARQALIKSIELCEARVHNLGALRPMLGQLDAHQETICQALLLVQSALTRVQATPAAVVAPDVEEIQRIVASISGQSRAVEQAVAEVTALRTGRAG